MLNDENIMLLEHFIGNESDVQRELLYEKLLTLDKKQPQQSVNLIKEYRW